MKFKVLLILHLTALHTSIAAMELFSWLIFAVAVFTMFQKREKPPHGDREWWWLIGFAAITIVGIIVSGMSQKEALFEAGFLRWMILLYSFAFAWKESGLLKNHDRLVWIWAGLAATAGAYAFYQYFTGDNFFRPHHPLPPNPRFGFRATGFFSQALTLAYVLGISIAFLLPQLRRLRNRHFFGIVLIMACLGLFASLSRGSWIALSFVIFVFAYQEWGRKALLGLIPAALLFSALFTFVPEFHYRVMDLFNTKSLSSGGERLDLWAGYWQIFRDHPIVGAGLFYGDEHIPAAFQQLGIQQEFVSHAHNNYLQALAGTGILGFIFFVLINFYFMRLAYQLFKKLGPAPLGRLAQGALLAQIYWQLGGLTECNFFDGEVNHSIIFSWALLLAIKSKQT